MNDVSRESAMQSANARRVFAPGERIFTEGDAPDVAYLIESGRIEVWASQAIDASPSATRCG